MQSNTIDEIIKDQLRLNGYNLMKVLINTQTPFRLVIWNNDDWSYELPADIMEHYKEQLVIDIVDDTLLDSYIDDEGEIFIETEFDENMYTKIINPGDIVAILDLAGTPIHLNHFSYKKMNNYNNVLNSIDIDKNTEKQQSVEYKKPTNMDELIEEITKDGIPKESAIKSIDVFKKYNKDKFQILNK